jgi:hypothetical protein
LTHLPPGQNARREWVLIRPDGYVGAIVSTADLAALLDYLDGVGARATGA